MEICDLKVVIDWRNFRACPYDNASKKNGSCMGFQRFLEHVGSYWSYKVWEWKLGGSKKLSKPIYEVYEN